MLQAELSVVAALMPPDDFDVALLRVRLSLKRSLTDRFVFDGLFSASGLGQPLFCCSTGARSDAVADLCFECSRAGLRWPVFCAGWPGAVPTVVCCVRVSDDLESDSLRFLVRRVEFRL